jgi:putative peptide zinc metalloprotease protein
MKMQDKDYCPQILEDVEITVLFQNKNGSSYSMGSKSCDRYIQLNDGNKKAVEIAINHMDGKTTVEEIHESMINIYHLNLDVIKLCEWLGKAGLLKNPPEDVSLEKQEMDYLSITIKKWKLDRFFDVFSFLGEKHGLKLLISSIVIIVVGMTIALMNWREFITLKNYELNNSLFFGIGWMLVVFVVSIGLHEIGHAVVGYHFGLKPKELVFALYVGTPMFYVKIPGIYTLQPKKRVYVWSVGVYVNLVIASICMILMQLMDGDIKNLLLIGVTTNLSLVVANLSPLLPLDGYFILSTLLQKPNLRKGSFSQFKNWFLGRENRFEGLYIVYFLLSVSFYSFVIICELRKIINIVSYGISHHYGAWDYMYEFRLIGVIISIIILKKIVDIVASHFNRVEKDVVSMNR